MTKKRVVFALAIAAALLCYTIYEVFFDDDSDNQLRAYSRKIADEAWDVLADQVGAELEILFRELDEDHDGVLSLHEFKDRRLAAAAAVAAARRNFRQNIPSLPRISLTNRQQTVNFLLTWFQAQILFILAGLIFENIRYLADPSPRELRLDNDYIDAEPERATIADALKYDTPMTLYERAKMAFFILSGIAALRAVLAFLFLLIGVVCLNIVVAGGRTRRTHPRWFSFWDAVICHGIGNLILIMLGFYCVRVYGQAADLSETKIVVGNHICAVETLLLFFNSKMPSFVSRIENLGIPGFKAVAQATSSILVNRDTNTSRNQTLEAIVERAKSKGESANRLMLFPEGTCNNGKVHFVFKHGAFAAGEPVQMFATQFPYRHFNMSWTGRAAGGNDFFDLFLRLLCQFTNHAEVRFLPVYYPSAAERADSVLYANHVQKMLAYVTRNRISDATFQNYKELERAYSQRKSDKGRYVYVDGATPLTKEGNGDHHHEQQAPASATPPSTVTTSAAVAAAAEAAPSATAVVDSHTKSE
jgi:1-acyl-sn-glycerol-3-phosphate acyltransferase